tara:strand:- start:834 stop:968 length:135 start_codon:yes stop_codon:yes gene_type:complete
LQGGHDVDLEVEDLEHPENILWFINSNSPGLLYPNYRIKTDVKE